MEKKSNSEKNKKKVEKSVLKGNIEKYYMHKQNVVWPNKKEVL